MKYEIYQTSEYTLAEFVTRMETMHPRLVPAIGEVAAELAEDSTITEICYTYSTLDEKQQAITMSSLLLVLRENGQFDADHLWLENRATQSANKNVPTQKWNIGEVHVLRHHVLVAPDLMSFGASIDRPICYLCGALAARNTVDAVIAAQTILQNDLHLISEPLPVFNSGHSQGGFDALAVLRYMETQATEEERKFVRIERTWCADGPYAPDVVVAVGCRQETNLYGAYMVMNTMSHLYYHHECYDPDVTIEDFLTDEAKALHLPEAIRTKEVGNKDLVKMTIGAIGMKLARLFTEDALSENGRLYQMTDRCSKAERQIDDWQPKTPVSFYHVEVDECVPVEATQEVEQVWGNLPNVTFEYDKTPLSEIEKGMAHAYSGAVFHQRLLKTPRPPKGGEA